jgi:hypothetical protein
VPLDYKCVLGPEDLTGIAAPYIATSPEDFHVLRTYEVAGKWHTDARGPFLTMDEAQHTADQWVAALIAEAESHA